MTELADKPMQPSTFVMQKKPNPWIVGLLAAGLLGTASVAYITLWDNPAQPDITNQTVRVASEDLAVDIQGNGVVQAVRKTNLSPRESGRITQLYVDEGDWVEQGELIARMERDRTLAQVEQYKAQLARTEADLAQKRAGARPEEIAEAEARVSAARANVNEAQVQFNRAAEERQRYQMLAQEGAIASNTLGDYLAKEREAKANLDAQRAILQERQETLLKLRHGTRIEEIAQAEAEVAQARAQLQYYETQLEDTLIRAPFAGIITRRFAQEGDFVTPTTSASTSDGATSTSIAELSSGLEVEAKVPEASIARIKPEQNVEVRTDAYPDHTFNGSVRLIAPRAVQENNVTLFRVKVGLETGQDTLKSGMNVKLSFQGEKLEDALVVPLAAIVTKQDGQTGVLIPNEENQAEFRAVKVGTTSGDRTQILEGVSAGERIFIEPPANQKIEGVDTLNLG